MSEERGQGTKELLGMLGGIIAVLMIIRYACLIAQNYIDFLPTEGFIYDAINYIGMYAPMALMVCVGLEATWDKGIIKLVFLILCAAIIIFSFFPDVWGTIVSYTGLNNI